MDTNKTISVDSKIIKEITKKMIIHLIDKAVDSEDYQQIFSLIENLIQMTNNKQI